MALQLAKGNQRMKQMIVKHVQQDECQYIVGVLPSMAGQKVKSFIVWSQH